MNGSNVDVLPTSAVAGSTPARLLSSARPTQSRARTVPASSSSSMATLAVKLIVAYCRSQNRKKMSMRCSDAPLMTLLRSMSNTPRTVPQDLADVVEDAYRMTAPAKLVAALDDP